MGWTLKKAGSRTQFTEGQRKFPTDQFLIGEDCGKKADPQQVSQEMRRVRDDTVLVYLVKKMSYRPAGGRFLLKTGRTYGKRQ